MANCDLYIISAYAPTLERSEKHQQQRDDFYKQLDATVSKILSRDFLMVVGDFNAKTGSSWPQYTEIMGRFGKGHTNSNGERLLEFASNNKLVLTQKSDGKPRWNPY